MTDIEQLTKEIEEKQKEEEKAVRPPCDRVRDSLEIISDRLSAQDLVGAAFALGELHEQLDRYRDQIFKE